MLTSITLRNFKSFGEEQTIPLQPITVLVGPNNSGKSNLMSLGRFVRNAVTGDAESAFSEEGGKEFVFHRPSSPDSSMRLAWETEEGRYTATLGRREAHATMPTERLVSADGREAWSLEDNRNGAMMNVGNTRWPAGVPFSGLRTAKGYSKSLLSEFQPIWYSMLNSREIKLSLDLLRSDGEVVPKPRLGMNGSNLPTVLGLWRGSDLERADQLQEFVKRCLPEIKHVLVKPSPEPGSQRLWIQQVDGEQFDAAHVSDGVLCFIALAMHAIEAEPGSLLFIEEPEQSIHPRRLGELVDLFRGIVHERQCQVVIATHSPVLLHQFRDEPEAIVLFRRAEKGTLVNPLTDFPDLMAALDKRAEPGEMLVNGFLNEPS